MSHFYKFFMSKQINFGLSLLLPLSESYDLNIADDKRVLPTLKVKLSNMNKLALAVLFFFVFNNGYSQLRSSADTISYRYRVDTIYSNTLKETRFIKLFLPEKYSSEKTYPVFFTLDESWMFEPVMVIIKQLTEANIIPPSIVVGVHSNNRSKDLRMGNEGNFTQSSRDFYQYLNTELFDYISKNITVPAFPILIGHSDAAVFSQKVLVENDQKFRAIISLSPQFEKGQLQEIMNFTARTFPAAIFHFVASGTKDATRRLKAVVIADSLFKTVATKNLHLKAVVYDVDHFAVANRALTDAVSFIFSDFVEDNDWDEQLLDSLRKTNTNPLDVIKNYQSKVKKIYNLDVIPRQEGVFSTAFAIMTNKKHVADYFDYSTSVFGKDRSYNTSYAQALELVNANEEALKYWNYNLEDSTRNNDMFFYYQRPLNLLMFKLNKPKEAAAFVQKWSVRKPEQALLLNYTVAKFLAEKKVEKKDALKAINYCIDNFKPTGYFKIEDAKKIKDSLE